MPADAQAPAAARHALAQLAPRVGPEVVRVAELLASELVNNAVQHGSGEGRHAVAVSVRVLPDALHVSVSDEGPGFVPAPRGQDQDMGSGWGLHILDSLALSWGLDDGRETSVWFELERDPVAA
jgi:anti-sigma regulatory factor (Ser/Thr protein kinase)